MLNNSLSLSWYAPYAFMSSIEDTTTFVTALESLEGFQLCELNANDDILDCARIHTVLVLYERFNMVLY